MVLAALLRPIVDRLGWPLWFTVALAMPLAMAIEPVRETLGYGQVNILLFALIMADLVGLRWRSRRGTHYAATDGPLLRFVYGGAWAGVGIGLATAVKLTPALFIGYLLITRQWRVAATADRHHHRRRRWRPSRSSATSRGPTSAACCGRPSGSAPPT